MQQRICSASKVATSRESSQVTGAKCNPSSHPGAAFKLKSTCAGLPVRLPGPRLMCRGVGMVFTPRGKKDDMNNYISKSFAGVKKHFFVSAAPERSSRASPCCCCPTASCRQHHGQQPAGFTQTSAPTADSRLIFKPLVQTILI